MSPRSDLPTESRSGLRLLFAAGIVATAALVCLYIFLPRPPAGGKVWPGDALLVEGGIPELYFVVTTLPLFMVYGYHATWYKTLKRKIEEDLKLCGLGSDQYQSMLTEFQVRNNPGAFAPPMIVNLALLMLFWALFFLPNGLAGLEQALVGTADIGQGYHMVNLHLITQMVVTGASAMSWAFLGAYCYSLLVLIRRWLQADLTTGALWKLNVRIAVAAIVGLLLERLLGSTVGPGIDYVAFAAGFVPDTVLRWLNSQVKRLFNVEGEGLSKVFQPSDLQDKIDGLNFWQADRLFDEGVESVEDLATKEIPALLVRTRFGTPHLIDWVDQALLCIQVGDQVKLFRKAFIRTATDVLELMGEERGAEGVWQSIKDAASDTNDAAESPISLPMLLNVVGALRHGPNLVFVQQYWENTKTLEKRSEALAATWKGAPQEKSIQQQDSLAEVAASRSAAAALPPASPPPGGLPEASAAPLDRDAPAAPGQ